jgi:D-sedoheptulose 7-phosphate isomerase
MGDIFGQWAMGDKIGAEAVGSMSAAEGPAAPLDVEIDALFRSELDEHRGVLEATARGVGRPFAAVLQVLERSLREGGKLLLFGNGGSAADAQHIAAELVIRYKGDRAAIPAIALTTDSSALTACGNDLGFDALFERQVEALGRKEDVAMGISTSGRSPNVLRGLRRARELGLRTVGLTGGTGGEMSDLCEAVIVIPSTVTARIQEMHITVGHMLVQALEQRLGLV